jgi:hypothetical protein
MNRRCLLTLALLAASVASVMAVTPVTAAVPATCFPALPAVPGSPLFTLTGEVLAQRIRLDVWRQACVDGSGDVAVLVQATPITPNPLLCSFSFRVIQSGETIQGRIRTSTASPAGFCNQLPFTTTFVLDEEPGEPPFIEQFPFTLIWATPVVNEIDVPQLRPPSPPPPRISIVPTGCLVCRPGDFAQVHLHLTNPGPPQNVEVKAGVHFPDGVTVLTVVDEHLEILVPRGESDILIPGIVIPEGVAFGAYLVEARLLDPEFGTTLSVDYLSMRIIP